MILLVTISYIQFTEFAECKKAEDSSVGLVNTCKEQLKCGGVATKEEGEKQLKALTP